MKPTEKFTEEALIQKLLQFLIAQNIPMRAGYSETLKNLLKFCRGDQ